MSELNPLAAPVRSLVMRAYCPSPPGPGWRSTQVGLTVAGRVAGEEGGAALHISPAPAAFAVHCAARARRSARSSTASPQRPPRRLGHAPVKLNATSRRWGGNPTSRYNWELGNVLEHRVRLLLLQRRLHGHARLQLEGFPRPQPRSRVGSASPCPPRLGGEGHPLGLLPEVGVPAQQAFDPRHNAGNGVGKDGQAAHARAPSRTQHPRPARLLARWVTAIRAHGRAARGRRVLPRQRARALERHPPRRAARALGYDELPERTVQYGLGGEQGRPRCADRPAPPSGLARLLPIPPSTRRRLLLSPIAASTGTCRCSTGGWREAWPPTRRRRGPACSTCSISLLPQQRRGAWAPTATPTPRPAPCASAPPGAPVGPEVHDESVDQGGRCASSPA